MNQLEDKLVHAIVATKVNLHYNEQLKFTPFYAKEVKHKGNLFLKTLFEREKPFEQLAEVVEDSAVDVHDVFWDFIKQVSKISIPHMKNVGYILEAYEKNPKAIEGIVNKILKQ